VHGLLREWKIQAGADGIAAGRSGLSSSS